MPPYQRPQTTPKIDELVQFERSVQSIYDQTLAPLARQFYFELPKTGQEATGMPSVVFLGNHSSGKSTFINYLLGTEIQKTGVAPTDDGFTVISYGDTPDEFDGETVATHSDLAYKSLQRFGPPFLARLRLKTYPHELLQSVTLIDSPGMIDTAASANTRGYDFAASVRYFAESADLILFFFDPDKPGTTGETVSIFTETLAGFEYKLFIIMNKVDLFPNIRDFARTYGTLCWNLSKTIPTKDTPHIFNVYLPDESRQERASAHRHALPLHDFDHSRNELIHAIHRAPTRRADNLVTELYKTARRLAMHTRICHRLAQEYRSIRNGFCALTALILLITGGVAFWTWDAEPWTTPALVIAIGIIVAAGTCLFGRLYLKKHEAVAATSEALDRHFQNAYRVDLGFGERADLYSLWDQVKKQVQKTFSVLGQSKIPYSYSTRKWLRKVEAVIDQEVPRLRRQIARQEPGRDGGQTQPAESGKPTPSSGEGQGDSSRPTEAT